MGMRTKVYVAGPISNGDLNHNINQAREAGLKLLKAGFAPWIPQLTCYFAGDVPEVLPHGTTHEDWMGMDLPWVASADVLLRLSGESKGADMECDLAFEKGIPIYESVESLIADNPKPRQPKTIGGDPRFHSLLKEIGDLHSIKSRDYGTGVDPYANVRASSEWGISPWLGALIRLNDKIVRLKQYAQRGSLANESAEDSMLDISVYALIALILHREEQAEKSQDK